MPNFLNGWSAQTLAPRTKIPTAPAQQRFSQTSPAPTAGGALPPRKNPAQVTPPTNTLQQLKQAALGNNPATLPLPQESSLNDPALGSRDPNASQGLGKAGMSASVYAHPDAPAFLTQAVNGLNGSPGFAQQNLTNLLLQQILGNFPNAAALHETETAAQKEADAHKIAQAKAAQQAAKAEAAKNEHAAALKLDRLRSNATMTPPTPVAPAASYGWIPSSF